MRECCLRTAVALGVLAGGSLLLGACVVQVDSDEHVERLEKRFEVSDAPEVTLTTFDGPIEVRGWGRQEVLVEIEKRGATRELLDGIEIVSEQDGNRVRVEARRPSGREWVVGLLAGPARRVKLVASVPRRADLLVRSSDGAITIERVTGRLELRTGDGRVRGIELAGDLTVHTGDGSVRLDSVDGRLDVTTGDGSIALTGRTSVVRAHTGDGSITVKVEEGTRMDDDWELTTGDGGVVVYLPGGFDAELDAHTGDGRVRSDLAMMAERDPQAERDESRSRRSLRTRLGGGGYELRVRTGDGSITFRTQ